MGAQSAPRLFERVEDFVFGHRLIDPPLQNPLRPAAGQGDRFVGGEQRYFDVFQFPFDGEAFERSPGNTRHALADHHVEPPPRMLRFVQQISDATVARNGNVEPLVVAALATLVEFHTPRLNVVEVHDDHP
ncbi:hypothetical protein AOZ06_41450 [Kibdelosporangium phytohabitans]|uniref:Uncharacterized protein n=1 Tax=Kibdelosporangium phytohabitans TaxID=860235 RepID=A0A0N9IBE2_9PSEU|nr:hypothetical protein [Kibdelosporangium phytohabitans]ALG12476.1 hypothetical protein AOZ06_41450 [Kibdelosporangium phytohabitans]